MRKCFGETERKVVKTFGKGSGVDAILFKDVDSIGITLGYVLLYVFSGQQLINSDMNVLINHYQRH